MSPTSNKEEIIAFTKDVITHVKEAYKKKNYVEAITVLHESIEFEMNLLFSVFCFTKIEGKVRDGKEIPGIKYTSLTRVLLHMNLITKEIFYDLKKFHALRNEIVHELFRLKIKKSKLEPTFNLGIKLHNEIIRSTFKILKSTPQKTEIN